MPLDAHCSVIAAAPLGNPQLHSPCKLSGFNVQVGLLKSTALEAACICHEL